MSPPDITVHTATNVSFGIFDGFTAGGLTNTEHERYVANATFGSRDVIDGLKIDGEVVEQSEERPGRAGYSISDASVVEKQVCLQADVKAIDKDLPSPK